MEDPNFEFLRELYPLYYKYCMKMETILKINLGGIGMKKKILAYGLSLLMMTSLSPATIYAVGSDAQDVYSYEKISSILNDEGQFVMYSVKPANEMQAMLYFQENMQLFQNDFQQPENCLI